MMSAEYDIARKAHINHNSPLHLVSRRQTRKTLRRDGMLYLASAIEILVMLYNILASDSE